MPTGDSNNIVLFYSTVDEAIIEVPEDQAFFRPFDFSASYTFRVDKKTTRKFLRLVGFVGAENLFPKKHRKARRARRREKVRRAKK